MNEPTYFIDRNTSWRDWVDTDITEFTSRVIAGTADGRSTMYEISTANSFYPGFTRAHQILKSRGCNINLVTDILKFSIQNADGLDLDKFLIESDTQSKVATALAIGLSRDELLKLLENPVPVTAETQLPDDLNCGPDA